MDYNKLYGQYQKLFEENQKLKAENEEYRKRLGLTTPVSCENCSGNISVEIDPKLNAPNAITEIMQFWTLQQ